ncbi:LysR family transcriptional regulator [Nocardiopsis sp. RSe5-2]|uniref:LysR family transcriptional regulator n=1 Tax=Nocardiopsis endophytica TaxID=3018445 RepID=A0ABT4TYR4_9ACTN|nr:LysR family transcriptional regulator [Nocardiopsis endophytica]MDA2809834.1 LysR family transcriptional regulator [Nocardiopsis endophytica]
MLDIHRLRVFRSVVASGSVQGAAANLAYTPSAVSQQITALQRETGLALFERAGRGLRPTPAGVALAAEADALLARLGEAESRVADLRAGRTGRLSIAYFASAGAAWLPSAVRGISEAFPGVRLDLRLSETLPPAAEDRADLQIAVETDRFDPGPGFSAHRLCEDPYLAVLPRDHPRAGDASIDLPDLAAEPWIDSDVPDGPCRARLVEACHAAGFSPPFRLQAHDPSTAMAFVSAGMGVTVIPGLCSVLMPAGLTAIPVVRPAPVRTVTAVLRSASDGPPLRAALDAFLALATDRPLPHLAGAAMQALEPGDAVQGEVRAG